MGSETTRGFAGTSPATSPDLELDVGVEHSGGRIHLTYQLRFGNRRLGAGIINVGSVSIADDPAAYLKDLFGEIQQLRTKDEQPLTQRRLVGIGTTLLELFPIELRRQLWAIHELLRDSGEPAPTLYLNSDESWVPWELLRLRDPDGKSKTGVYLADAFALTRWLHGHGDTIEHPFSDVAVVASKKSGLPQTAGEQQMLLDRDGEDGRRVAAIDPATYAKVTRELESGRYDGWHFAGHGLPQGNDPNLWAFRLENRKTLKPLDLAEVDFADKRPLVFMNSCHGGRGGLTLTGIGGWADAFVKAGVGAFVGAYWDVSDGAAKAFSEVFYERFLGGEALGETVRGARARVREEFPGDPTWAAYTVYGHPLAVCSRPAEKTAPQKPSSSPPQKPSSSPMPSDVARDVQPASGRPRGALPMAPEPLEPPHARSVKNPLPLLGGAALGMAVLLLTTAPVINVEAILTSVGIPAFALWIFYALFKKIKWEVSPVPREWAGPLLGLAMILLAVIVLVALYAFRIRQ